MDRYELYKIIEDTKSRINDLKKALNLEKLNKRLLELNNIMQESNFWDNSNHARLITKEHNELTSNKETFIKLNNNFNDLELLSSESLDNDTQKLIEEELINITKELSEFEIKILLNEEYDDSNIILELHPGAGGTESMDWCGMLLRMYERYTARKNFKLEVLNYIPGEEAGVKSVTLKISGPYAYGYFKSERGVHRLVRISPFDSNKRRHTSFVSCDIAPELSDNINIEIRDEDIRVDTYQSSGPGGQSVNTTYSAVRITHLPTNIVVSIQNERSQIKNKEAALTVLRSKLFQLELEKKEAKLKEIKGEKGDIAWGNQIRSYVFQPYQMVKDHRTNYETSNLTGVMDGDLDQFINAYLKEIKHGS
ncbi:MAG: peptide chain release factor 2 [Acholeplasmataceae bacterium]